MIQPKCMLLQHFAIVALLSIVGSTSTPASAQASMKCPTPFSQRLPAFQAYEAALLEPGSKLPVPSAEDFKAYGAFLEEVHRLDWAGRCHYRAANANITNRPSVVFLGDSITEYWAIADPGLFTKYMVNRGIGGQTTLEMLGRMRQDVLGLQPKVLHFLGGVNDISHGVPLWEVKENILSIVDLAQTNGIYVVLGSVLPVSHFLYQPDERPAQIVLDLNLWLKNLAAKRCLGFIDYHSALTDADNGLPASIGNDGLHPHRDGYRPMAALLKPALQVAMSRASGTAAMAGGCACSDKARSQVEVDNAKCN